ncbi:MAG: ATP-binding protein [Opitutales bacterium]|nr:ATP-binding protein [Opitutales bacterium]
MWIGRQFESLLRKGAETRPVVVLTGPRQTGKTSLVRRLFPDHGYVNLDLPSEAAQAEGDPLAFLSRHGENLIIDEVQYAPALFRHLKRVVDGERERTGRFILTGSQPFQLMQGVSESLAGRAHILHLDGLSYREIREAGLDLSVEAYVWKGGFPELHERPSIDPAGFYHSYVATYLERDLRMQLQVGNLRDFERFLRACALRTSQLINRAEMARDVGISPTTAGQWLSALEQSGVITLLEPWFSNATKSLVKTPKLHFYDSGLCAFLMGLQNSRDLFTSPLAGALWETTVFTEIRKHLAVHGGWQLAFWRDRTKEADFLLHRAGRFILADAKWSENPSSGGKLPLVRKEIEGNPPAAIISRVANAFPLPDKTQAIPLGEIGTFLDRE